MSDPDPHLTKPAPVHVAVEAEADHDATRNDLKREIVALREEVSKLNNHKFLRVYAQFWRLIGFQLLRGMAFGLGSVVGATILVSVVAYLLSQIDFIPILAEWAAELDVEFDEEKTEAEVEQQVEEQLPAPEGGGVSPPENAPQTEPGEIPPANAD
ncbi:DUF5665 domain-containing protein [Vannielia litorea]|uniref:Uncharacterized protein n=1 Tax=Vannielia litorea TaxID=1217970 RepID=A0A1N6HAI1_9RHOB|nr:DUF5665 domain-containing protein [Vannielia litorea]SIO16792.1 hypothetical protein SAMN05444002_3216 [Vannielia litorea]